MSFGLVYVLSQQSGGSNQSLDAIDQQISKTDPQCEVDHCVDINNGSFTPSELAVKKGEIVQFNSKDELTHNIAVGRGTDHGNSDSDHDDSGSPDHEHVEGTESGEFGVGEGWRVEFMETGSYLLHDHYNPELSMLVVVYDQSATRIE